MLNDVARLAAGKIENASCLNLPVQPMSDSIDPLLSCARDNCFVCIFRFQNYQHIRSSLSSNRASANNAARLLRSFATFLAD
jgi:hypothetical protein